MARPATHHEARKAAIVEAALDCFTTFGYDGATNRRIAEAAGMKSGGIIYHYFPSKEDLFQACLEHVSAFDTMHGILVANQDDPPDSFLRKVGRAYLEQMQADKRLIKLVLMVFSAFQTHPELPPLALRRIAPTLILPLLAYYQREVDAGTLRPMPPLSVGQQFFGPLAIRVMTSHLLGAFIPVPQVSDEVFVENLVQTFLEGAHRRDSAMPLEGGHSH